MSHTNHKYCVYLHTNQLNGKKYVGITCRKPEYRWNSGKGYSNQPKFYNAIKKYGWDSFTHTIIAKGLPEECAKTYEKIYIVLFDTIENGYNNTAGGDGATGRIVSEETRQKLSKALKGRDGRKGWKMSQEHKNKISESHKGKAVGGRTPKAILQIREGEIISEYRCGTDAAKALNKKSCSHIYQCLNNERKTAYGYEWRYKE